MKRLFSLATCLFVCLLCAFGQTENNGKTRTIAVTESFTKIVVKGVGGVVFTQADKASVRLEGGAAYVKAVSVTIANGCLTVDVDDKFTKIRNIHIYVSAPNLEEVTVQGVGNFTAKNLTVANLEAAVKGVGDISLSGIKCNNMKLSVQGAGSIDANLNCSNRLFVSLEGVGSINLSGYAKRANFSRRGLGLLKKKTLTVDEEI